MTGPTRPQYPGELRAAERGRTDAAADVFDELEQFVDTAPANWSARRSARRGAFAGRRSGERRQPRPDALDMSEAFEQDMGEAAFSRSGASAVQGAPRAAPVSDPAPELVAARAAEREPAHQPAAQLGTLPQRAPERGAISPPQPHRQGPGPSSRREQFAQRLDEELSRPAPPEPRVRPQTRIENQPAPQASRAPRVEPTPPRMAPPESMDAAAAPRPLPREAATPVRPAPPEPVSDPERAVLPEVSDDDEPVDALDWELDNAISAIIANNHRSAEAQAQDGPVRPAPSDEPDTAAARPGPESAPRPPVRASLPAPTPAPAEQPAEAVASPPAIVPAAAKAAATGKAPQIAPGRPPAPDKAKAEELPAVAPIGSHKRLRPIPTFQFDRRDEPDDEDTPVAHDPDNPLSSIFFNDVREQFDAVHSGKAGDFDDLDDDDPGVVLDDIGPDGLDDEYSYDGDEDSLPPSLRRVIGPRRIRRKRLINIAAGLASVALLAVAVMIGINVLAGSEKGGDPPLIRADARDVKVRPEVEDSIAEPDIRERTQLGETEELVVPDPIHIGRAAAPSESAALVSYSWTTFSGEN